jgi:GntR family transcriptional repressor for pyruvate dehydrogenase complex
MTGQAPKREKPQQIADELRWLILSGELADGDSLGREPELVERFGVSRPSLREALRILEAEHLVEVVRGMRGGVVVRSPDPRGTARSAAMVLQARHVSVADVYDARALLEPVAARAIASKRNRKPIIAELRKIVDQVEESVADAASFGLAFARFDEQLVALAGNQTLAIIDEILNEIVARSVSASRRTQEVETIPLAYRSRGVRSLQRLLTLLEEGDGAAAEAHWRLHLTATRQITVGADGAVIIDNVHHDEV